MKADPIVHYMRSHHPFSGTDVNKETPDHKAHARDGGGLHPAHGPYWARAHRDWRAWVGAVLMAIALGIFVLSGDLGWLYRTPQPHGPLVSGSQR